MGLLTSSRVEQPSCTGAQGVFAHPIEHGSPTCGQRVSYLWPTRMYYVARGQNNKLCTYTINITQ